MPLGPPYGTGIRKTTVRHASRLLQSGNCSKERRPRSRVPPAAMTEISLRFEPPFARIILNRPERRNAISRAMWRALPAIRTAIEAREDLLATRDHGDAVQDGLKALMGLDRPTIAVIRGVAIGAGLGLALACDLRFCAADAHLAIP